MDDDADAKVILTAPLSPDNLKRPPGRPRITWLNTVQRDLRAYNLTLNGSRPGPEPSFVEADVYVRRYALVVVRARTEEDMCGDKICPRSPASPPPKTAIADLTLTLT